MLCYCGSAKSFTLCCWPLLSGQTTAQTCEQLMRSRYSAYCHNEINYIHQTYHVSTRADNAVTALSQFAKSCHFVSLNVNSVEEHADEGYVHFCVSYIQHNLLCQFSERSRFVYQNGWYYIDGVLQDASPVKIGRNDLCPCGSNKKFKLCTEHKLSGNA